MSDHRLSKKQRTRLLIGILFLLGVFALFSSYKTRTRNEEITAKYYDLYFQYKEQETKMEKLQKVLEDLQLSLDNCKAENSLGTTQYPD